MRKVVVIIPCYNPDEKYPELIRELKLAGFADIVSVNDGSRAECADYFAQAKEQGVILLTHAVNMGKGRALKTAFNYLLNEYGRDVLAICVDSDGQHLPEDVVKVREALLAEPEHLIMGCRSFSDQSIPLRSRFGNQLTRRVFNLLCGVKVSDTQTGLRGLSGERMARFLTTRGERYEFEMNMLIETKDAEIPIREVPIQAVYLDQNMRSHFNPLRDSLRIYSVFVKFLLSSIAGFVVDYSLFALLNLMFRQMAFSGITLFGQTFSAVTCGIFAATVLARVVSSLVNFSINQRRVFRQNGSKKGAIVRYYLLCFVQMLASAGLVSLLAFAAGGYPELWKIPVDILLFFASFQIQREWVFKKQ